jgi:paraquat-inducible protein B
VEDNEGDGVTDEDRREAPTAQARVRQAKWSPWVWVIPALAILFAGWLVVRYGFFGGGDITVRFVEARGLDRYSPVRFRGAKVGSVQKITVDKNLREVVVRIAMDASMNHALRQGTRFWIVEPGLESGGLGGLLSGTYVAIEPGAGDDTSEFVGQEYPPVVAPPTAGRTFILEGEGTGAIGVGAPVMFEGMRVGRVLGSEYDGRRGTTSTHVFVVERFADRVRQATRFYREGGLNISLAGGGLSMGGASLASLLNSGISFYTPEILAGEPVANGTRFELHSSRNIAMASADGPSMTYLTYFPGPVQGLAPGAVVRMKGVDVGFVRDVRLRYIPSNATLQTPVLFEIDPQRLEMPVGPASTREELRRTMNDALARLVQKGMRARLNTSLVLPGASGISLDIVAPPNTGRLGLASDPPIVPAASTGSGIDGALSAVTDVATTIRNLPLQEIAGNLRNASERLNRLMSDPALDQSLQRLNSSLAEIERVTTVVGQNAGPITRSLRNAASNAESATATAKENVEPIVTSLRNAASSAEAAATRAQQLLGTSQKQNYDVTELIRELTRAAEAVRALATYINENPDALIKGRAK